MSRGNQRGRGTRIRSDRVLKGREEAAALLLLTSEQGLESLSRLKPNCGCWALSAESGGSQLPASEPRRRGMRGTLGWLETWQSFFWLCSRRTLLPSCEPDRLAAPGMAREIIFFFQLGRLVLCVHHAQLRSRPTPHGFSTGGQVSPFKNSGSSTSSSPGPLPFSPPSSPPRPPWQPRIPAAPPAGEGGRRR